MTAREKPYSRQVYYYETDRMGIVHHSNYIRWMEEARVDYMCRQGLPYDQVEKLGIIMPVTGVDCRYVTSLRFGDSFEVRVRVRAFNGVRMTYSYAIIRMEDGALAARGESSHCFLNDETRKPLSIKRSAPALYEKILALLDENCNT